MIAYNEESAEFKIGYDASCSGMDRDKSMSADWLRGFDKAREDNERGDYDPRQLELPF